jgi:hypothetical protein
VVALRHLMAHVDIKQQIIEQGALQQILRCCLYEDLEIKRDCVYALADISDSLEFQQDVVREGTSQSP